MNVQTIKRRLRAKGPFILRTSDGEEYVIPHPEFVMVGRYNVVIEDEKGGIDIVDPLHVVALHRASRAGKNGE